ncbi:MAG TPA: hypothetical protein VHO46_08010 [Bacteroidales bacterium]|nr:hypothetical protein [Bacteroidales bacterium]
MDQIKNHPLYRKHDLDSVMSSMWDFYKKNFISLFIISIVISLITQFASTFIDIKELQSITDPILMIEKMKEFMVPAIITVLISLFLNTVLQHYIIFHPVGESGILNSLVAALRYYLPFLVIMILFAFVGAIGLVLGVLALIIGAFFVVLYLIMLYLFILPILMIEGPDIGRTISRTFTLAHRNFWANMGWVAIFLIIMIVISVVLSSIIMIPFAGNFLKTIFSPGSVEAIDVTKNPVFIILASLSGAITLPLMPILSCIMYFNAKAGEDEFSDQKPVEYRPTIEDLYSKP